MDKEEIEKTVKDYVKNNREMSKLNEYIICSAYKLKEPYQGEKGQYKHSTLCKDYGQYDDIYDIAIGRRHSDIIHRYGKQIMVNTDGFYTSYGRYVTREEAYKIAESNGQIICKHGCMDILYSEDIFD